VGATATNGLAPVRLHSPTQRYGGARNTGLTTPGPAGGRGRRLPPAGSAVWQAVIVKDLGTEPDAAITLCRAAHARLLAAVQGMSDEQVCRPSRLPGWTVAHVLTHIARNADGHVRRLEAALRGEELARYPGGSQQRSSEITDGSQRRAHEIVSDLSAAEVRLEDVWERSVAAGWPHRDLMSGDHWATIASPSRRLREVEMHHVDLGIGYEPSDWPEEYVSWELPRVLATVPDRVEDLDDMRQVVAWFTGRGPVPAAIHLSPWS
jgi:maleylpyruvate isomerase